jgi:hypothetical protein
VTPIPPAESVLLPWLMGRNSVAHTALLALRGSSEYSSHLATLEAAWFSWACRQCAAWTQPEAAAVFDAVDRLVTQGHRRHDAERLALAAALADEALELRAGTAAP